MAELLRSVAARLREFVGNRRRAPRYKTRLPFSVSLIEEQGRAPARSHKRLEGYTCDISATGLGLIVPSIRVGEHYLTGEDRHLLIALEIPRGIIYIQAAPVRYERLEDDESGAGYLLGVHITEMSEDGRTRLAAYLQTLANKR